eukprot:SAG25_NODE_4663_length_772_cov_2.065379_1_plen_48_part_10
MALRRALRSCERALQLSPAHPLAYTTRGMVLHSLRRHREALDSTDRCD